MTFHRHPLVVLVNHSTVLDDAEIDHALPAFQRQVTYHFQPHWNAGATLARIDPSAGIPADAWVIAITDDSDQAGALGYHELSQQGIPVGFVFAKTDRDNGLSWSVTLSHELLEMLGDPYADECIQVAQHTFLAYETADAVEADQDGYQINGVLVSDFVYPNWFVAGSSGPWDHRGLLTAPLQLRPGGYIGVWTPTHGWQQATARGRVAGRKLAPRHDQGPRFRLRNRPRPVSFAPDWEVKA